MYILFTFLKTVRMYSIYVAICIFDDYMYVVKVLLKFCTTTTCTKYNILDRAYNVQYTNVNTNNKIQYSTYLYLEIFVLFCINYYTFIFLSSSTGRCIHQCIEKATASKSA